ncbi:hypothetical protein PVIIG_03150 [Plasmodium vivax India VII]|uniref:Uncharacterized protein n=1 Tax=Plasmodium vivax India VII TaxID=1077284 RepID=A0A0J9V490_PLAVI|nr:hypothetical protein PVIIG_03150 [Plasmodium vivax India VII]
MRNQILKQYFLMPRSKRFRRYNRTKSFSSRIKLIKFVNCCNYITCSNYAKSSNCVKNSNNKYSNYNKYKKFTKSRRLMVFVKFFIFTKPTTNISFNCFTNFNKYIG